MTSMLDRLNGATDMEGAMPIPESLPAVPGTSAMPWWTGVPGLDPDVRWASVGYAAECAAIACGIYVLGLDAGRADWLRGQMKSPVKTWLKWLVAGGEAELPKRAMTLRLVCERSAAIGPDYIVKVADDLRAAGTVVTGHDQHAQPHGRRDHRPGGNLNAHPGEPPGRTGHVRDPLVDGRAGP